MPRPSPAPSGAPPGARALAPSGAPGLPGAQALSGARRYTPGAGVSGARNAVRFRILPKDDLYERGAPRDHGVYRSGVQVGTIYGIAFDQWKIVVPLSGTEVLTGWTSSYAEAEGEALRLLREQDARRRSR